MIDYRSLETLDTVVREGGFEKAARVLHITQSAVSQRVKSLEDNAGQVLLVRSSPPSLTEAGERMVKHFRQVASLEQGLRADLGPAGDHPFTSLPVGVNADSLATWFLDAVDDVLRQENILLDLVCDDQDATHELLRRGKVLGCVSSHPDPMQGCEAVRLGCMPYIFAVSPIYMKTFHPNGPTPESLRMAPLAAFNRKDELQKRFLEPLDGWDPKNAKVHYLPSSEQFVQFVVRGHAAGMLPEMQVTQLLNSEKLINLFPNRFMPVTLYWHCWSIRSKALQRLTDALVSGAAEALSA